MGKNVAEKRNSGIVSVVTMSMSDQPRMNVVPKNPSAAKVRPMSAHAGRAISDHHEFVSPSAAITTRKLIAYNCPRMSAQPISPVATSAGLIGVANAAS